MKTAGMRVRVERELRDDFVDTCRREGRQASHVLREFMTSYVVAQARGRQVMLFDRAEEAAANDNSGEEK
jgi:hypothetical protein